MGEAVYLMFTFQNLSPHTHLATTPSFVEMTVKTTHVFSVRLKSRGAKVGSAPNF